MILVAFADDLMASGKEGDIKNVFSELHERFLLKEAGQLNNAGDNTCILGRNLEIFGETIFMFGDKEYALREPSTEFNMKGCPARLKSQWTRGRIGSGAPPPAEPH